MVDGYYSGHTGAQIDEAVSKVLEAPTPVASYYLHSNDDTGALEWVELIIPEGMRILELSESTGSIDPEDLEEMATGHIIGLAYNGQIYVYKNQINEGYEYEYLGFDSTDVNHNTLICSTISVSSAGTYSSASFTKSIEVDSALSDESVHPVQNAVVTGAINTLDEKINGKKTAYVISDDASATNRLFNSTETTIVLNVNASIVDVNNNTIPLANLIVGDDVLITEENVPDRWVISKTNETITFTKLDVKIDLSNYVQKSTTVNGHALSSNVTVTASDVGLGSVVNTGDSATPIENGTTKFTTGGAYTELNKKVDKTQFGEVVLSTTEGNLTNEQIAEIEKPFCVMIYDNTTRREVCLLSRDRNEISSVYEFRSVPYYTSSGANAQIHYYTINAGMVSKTYTVTHNTLDLYTDTQIDKLLNAKVGQNEVVDNLTSDYVAANPQPTTNNFITNVYYTRSGSGTELDPYVYTLATAFAVSTTYYVKTIATVAALNTALDTKQDNLVNQQNIKSINGNSILGSGNLDVRTFQPFPASWASYTTGTTSAFCAMVNNDTSATEGMAYLGDLRCSDFSSSGIPISNGEAIVEIIAGVSNNKVICIHLTSGNVKPYSWDYTWWNGSSPVGWHSYVPSSDLTDSIVKNGTNAVKSGAIYDALDLKLSKAEFEEYSESVEFSSDPLSGASNLASIKVGDDKWNIKQIDVDNALSDVSENPVQNKVVKGALDNKQNSSSVLSSVAERTTGTGLLKLTNGVSSLDTNTYLTEHQPVDAALSGTSENPVQNKVVKAALDLKANAADIDPLSVVMNTEKSTDPSALEVRSITLTDNVGSTIYNIPEPDVPNIVYATTADIEGLFESIDPETHTLNISGNVDTVNHSFNTPGTINTETHTLNL